MFLKRLSNLLLVPKSYANVFFPNAPACASSVRFKYMQHKGVKGIRSRKSNYEVQQIRSQLQEEQQKEDDMNNYLDNLNLEDRNYDEVVCNAMNVYNNLNIVHNVFVIQPYVKWGSKKNTEVMPEDQLKEAESLIRSLPNWSVGLSIKVPLESLEKKTLFGSGKMQELKAEVNRFKQHRPLTCLFVSKGTLSFAQKRILESEFGIPVMDRYSVVIQILRLHATTAEARLQVAMAELPYIWAQTKDANLSISRKQGYSLTDTQRDLLRRRENKLKLELERIRGQRKLLRKKRKGENYPLVAVVGYTNAGKTSLIKALTDERTMQPRDQLFATLDVTAHAGKLPCNLDVIYMDTVGFMSDLPTGLIECFVATLEDAMLADVLVHVQDLSHDCCAAQIHHVEATLQALARSINSNATILPPIINVANKIDLVTDSKKINISLDGLHMVSAKYNIGLNELVQDIEQKVLIATDRKNIVMRIKNGGNEMAWLYKNSAVTDMHPCSENAEQMIINVIISEQKMQQFKQYFCQ